MKKEIPKETKLYILNEYKQLLPLPNIVPFETSNLIWSMWQNYSGRTDKWRGCASCLRNKIRFFNSEMKKYKDDLETF